MAGDTLGLRDSGGLEKRSVAQGKAEGDRPFFQTPLNPENQILSLSPETLFVLLYLNNGKTKLSKKII